MRNCKKILLLLCVTALCLCACPLSAAATYELPSDVAKTVNAKAVIAVYVEASATAAEGIGGKDVVLFEKSADLQLDPAAAMRVMVGLYAKKLIDDKKLDLDKTTGTYTELLRDNYIWGTGLTLANMEEGETWTLRDLLMLSMIQTAADAAVTLAATTAGSVDLFVQGMNDYMRSLGCTGTMLANVTGIDNPNQKTTAHDLYVAMRYAMEDPLLSEALSSTECTVTPVKGGEPRSWESSNYMLRESDYLNYYEAASAGKTGVSDLDGKALVSLCRSDNYRYLTVVLGCPLEDTEDGEGSHYAATRALVNWAVNNFTYRTLVDKNEPMTRAKIKLSWSTDSLTLWSVDSLTGLVPNELDLETIRTEITLDKEEFEAPIKRGDVLGHATLYIREDQAIGSVDLVAAESVNRSALLLVADRIGRVFSSPVTWVLVGILVILIVIYIGMFISNNKEKRRGARRGGRRYRPMK